MTRISLDDHPSWTRLHQGQFVIYLADARTDVLLDPWTGAFAANDTEVPVFDSIDEAAAFGEDAVQRIPTARANVYDHHGRAGDSLRRIYPVSLRRKYDPLRRARRDTWIGGTLLAIFILWACTVANNSNTHFFWFYMMGMKILVLGSIFFIRGVGSLLDHRTR